MRSQPSLRFRFFTEKNKDVSHPNAEPSSPHADDAPPPSRRNRLTARQEWLQAELEQIAQANRVNAA